MTTSRFASPAPRYILLAATAALALGGLLMIYSAASVSDYQKVGDIAHHLKRQAIWIAVGSIVLVALARIDYRFMSRMALPFLIVTDALLVAVDMMGVGKYGAQRWLSVGPVTIQPSEFAKLACLIAVAALLVRTRRKDRTLRGMAKPLALIVLPVVALVMMQPDMGTTMTILIAVYIVLLLGGTRGRDLAVLAAAGASAIPVMIITAPYRAERFVAFLRPWDDPKGSGYQIIQALYAFGSGGFDGVGLGLSRQKFFYLPAAHTDFIFAIIGEELGLIGTLLVVFAFALIAWAGFRIALQAKDPFGRLLAGGLTSLIVTQAIVNMMAVTGLMPVTGIPLPFVSFGGNSMLFNLACVGFIVSVQRFGGRAVRSSRTDSGALEEVEYADPDERRRDGRPRLSGIDGGRRAAR